VTETDDFSDVLEWFSIHDLTLSFTEAEGYTWANLVRMSDGAVFARRYGRGASKPTAARRARQRWEQEQ